MHHLAITKKSRVTFLEETKKITTNIEIPENGAKEKVMILIYMVRKMVRDGDKRLRKIKVNR